MNMPENKSIKVSIIIPTYKRELSVFSRALESLCNQSYTNIEVIVIDDSPNEYKDRMAIKQYIEQKKDARIHYVANETNLGGSIARNKGIDIATGDFITFLDDDDEYLSCKIEHQIEYMQIHDVELTFSNMIIVNDAGQIVDSRNYEDIKSFDNAYLFKYHLMRHMTGTPTFMFKSDALRRIHGFDDVKKGQEFYLMLKAIQKGLKIGYLNKCDVIVHKHKGESISSGNNQIEGEKQLYIFKKVYRNKFSNKEWRFISFRHYAVLSIACKREHQLPRAVGNLMIAFLCAPIQSIQQFLKFKARISGTHNSL